MLDDDHDASGFNPPDADAVYANYCETCRRLGIEPVSRERAQDLMREWADVFAGRSGPPITH